MADRMVKRIFAGRNPARYLPKPKPFAPEAKYRSPNQYQRSCAPKARARRAQERVGVVRLKPISLQVRKSRMPRGTIARIFPDSAKAFTDPMVKAPASSTWGDQFVAI